MRGDVSVGRNANVILWGAAFMRAEKALHPNELLHWETMRSWKERGATCYDMGGGGEYKAKYGAKLEPKLSAHQSDLQARGEPHSSADDVGASTSLLDSSHSMRSIPQARLRLRTPRPSGPVQRVPTRPSADNRGVEDDWRLSGNEGLFRGAVFSRKAYRRWSPEWDHDHCPFCWTSFSEADSAGELEGALREGYSTAGPPADPRDDYYWVCPSCFDDLREHLGWSVRPDAG
jgi:hypothetical protein